MKYMYGIAARLRALRSMANTRAASFANSRRPPLPDNSEDWPFHQYLSLPDYETDRTGYPRVVDNRNRPEEE